MKNLEIDKNKITSFCSRWKIKEFSIFGSVLREDFSQHSDIDVLVLFAGDTRWTLFDFAAMQEELTEIFKRPVDLVSRRGLEKSENYLRREEILRSAEVIYAA